MSTVLVTGAGGFLGGTIVEALFFGGKHQIRAGLARWLSAPRVARLPVTLVQCDILKPAELANAMAGVDYVIHCAAGDRQVIVEGTRNVVEASIKADVKRIVHISTASIYGQVQGEVTEAVRPTAPDEYGMWKFAAERAFHRGLEWVILRPSIIYGPFAVRWTMLYAMRLKAGWKHLGSLGEGTCNLVHANDVARYAIVAMDHPDVVRQVFNINGPDFLTWNDYLECFRQHLGLPAMIPQTVNQTKFSVAASEVGRYVGKYAVRHHMQHLRWLSQRSDRLRDLMDRAELRLRLALSQYEVTLFGQKAYFVANKAEQAFGFKAQIDVDTGLGTTVKWLEHMGEPA